MKHAYLIIAHNKFKQLQLLVDLLAFALFYDTLRGIIYLFFIPKAWNIHISMSIIQVVGKVRPDETGRDIQSRGAEPRADEL